MVNYYTNKVTEDIVKALHEKGYSFKQEENVDVCPTYAEVFDWLLNNKIMICCYQTHPLTRWVGMVYQLNIEPGPSIGSIKHGEDFFSVAKQTILFGVSLIK